MRVLLELRGIRFSYPGRRIFEGLNFVLSEGARVGLTGPNGAGKTTLLRLLVGLERPEAGEVLFRGRPCRGERDFQRVRREVALVFQDPDDQLFCPTVEEELAFGPLNLGLPREEIQRRIRETLARLGLSGFEKRVTYRLSGGEKRLVALGSVLVMSPRAILLDEPTGDLDRENAARLTEILCSLPVALLVVSHEPEFLRRVCHRVLRLEDGRLREDRA